MVFMFAPNKRHQRTPQADTSCLVAVPPHILGPYRWLISKCSLKQIVINHILFSDYSQEEKRHTNVCLRLYYASGLWSYCCNYFRKETEEYKVVQK